MITLYNIPKLRLRGKDDQAVQHSQVEGKQTVKLHNIPKLRGNR